MGDQNQHLRLWVGGAFIAGILLTLGYKDVYPDLERRYRAARQPKPRRLDKRSSVWTLRSVHKVELKDNTADPDSFDLPEEHIAEGIEGCIGNTPLIKIKSLSEATGCEILAKAEFLNGAGNSPKDRVALSIINMAEDEGILTPNSGDMIYEGTVGSTGISLAAICRARGYLAHICMPDDMALEKSDLLLRLGAEVERVRPAPIVDQNQFVNKARARAIEHTNDPNKPGRGVFADQFETDANWRAHYEGTGPEIYEQTGRKLDAFVTGAGTGGTISGVALFLKPRLPKLKVVLADPQGSGLFNRVKYGVMFDPKEREGTRRRHQVDTIVEGIGINRVTNNFEAGRELVDDAIRVTDAQAMAMARWLVEKDGIFIGSSSAVNCKLFSGISKWENAENAAGVAVTKLAQQMGPGHRLCTILCDR
ncbi:Cysteine synthase/cystathionine beta-synthase P-phosphate-binding site [Macrophomina phaseolina MS6]|uniref:cysteine synthase n=1 Tax=Macrophomina phaseolina (strain MS6) TaxID=1126212 RepID=K2SZK3_MACPH|nr:Cysteine synthase/cystathionine beta-synthase P-phosphate-binding site [Macrophomina phaseolina MS6]